MQKTADIKFNNNRFCLTGELDCYNVMSVYEKSLTLINNSTELEFDFSSLKSSDSAGIVLIMEWIKYAKKHNKPLRFYSLSNHLISIAKAAGLDQLINSYV